MGTPKAEDEFAVWYLITLLLGTTFVIFLDLLEYKCLGGTSV